MESLARAGAAFAVCIATTGGAQIPVSPEPPYRAELLAARAAERAHNDSAAHRHYLRALDLIHHHPDLYYLLARSEARLGQLEAAVRHLRTIASMGLSYAADSDSAFAGLRERTDFKNVVAHMTANRSPVSTGAVVYTLRDTNALAEDLTYDPVGHAFLVSSVHLSKVIALPEHGSPHDFAVLPWSGFGAEALAVDTARGAVWVTVSGVPQTMGYRSEDSGQSSLLRLDRATGKIRRRYEVPRDGRPHDLGDMTIGPDGNVVVSDGESGGVYTVGADASVRGRMTRKDITCSAPSGAKDGCVDPSAGRDSSGVADPAKDVLRELVAPGTFKSPQAPVVLADGRILVADYALGLAVVDPRTRRVSWIVHPDSVALSGIDGMVLRGHELYAIQNGVAPERVVRIDLDGAFARVAGLHVIERATARLGEPTHGIIVGNGFYFIANSGWDRFGPDGRMTAQHRGPPAIVRVPLPPPEGG